MGGDIRAEVKLFEDDKSYSGEVRMPRDHVTCNAFDKLETALNLNGLSNIISI